MAVLSIAGWVLLAVGGWSGASKSTDFGIRAVGGAPSEPRAEPAVLRTERGPSKPFSLASAAAVAARHGIVTSTVRTAARNRAVGGASNSWHLHGRAIDIVRRPGISHGQLAAAFRAAGFRLIESLDEGDHSHFAFGTGPGPVRARPATEQFAEVNSEARFFRFVSVPSTGGGR